jgi:hypothetical protein
VRRGLVGDDVEVNTTAKHLGEEIGCVPLDGDRQTPSPLFGRLTKSESLIERSGRHIEIAGIYPALDSRRVHLDT